jgi:hypothetical protein
MDRTSTFPAILCAAALTGTASAQIQGGEERRAKIERYEREQLERTTAVVRGRCVEGQSGEPLAGCRVDFHGWPSNRRQMALHPGVEWQDPEPVVTGSEGRFEFRFVPPPPYQHSMSIELDGRYPRTARWGAFEPGQVDDLGDIGLLPGFHVTGRAVDTEGDPLANISRRPTRARASPGSRSSGCRP